MQKDYQELNFKALAVDEEDTPFLIFEVPGFPGPLTLEVGPYEAHTILCLMENDTPPRPLTHELLAQVVKGTGWQPKGLYIYGGHHGEVWARWRIQKGWKSQEYEIRPSDGVALALKTGFPLYVKQDFLPRWSQNTQDRKLLHQISPQHIYLNASPRQHAPVP